jgi:ABC-type transporter Mla maintaining outer membrane lipid asymmetry ATPase subunit MlaF
VTEREAVIEVRGLRNQFGTHVVHDDLDLDVWRGEILGVVGGSGTGKSVLLRSIAGLQRPRAGSVRMLGTDMETTTEAERARLSDRVGVMFQDGALFSSLTVRENVEVPLGNIEGLDPATREALAGSRSRSRACPGSRATSTPPNSRAACGSAPASPAPSRSTPRSCSSTNRPPASTPSARRPSTI